jgi:hypothetical protein
MPKSTQQIPNGLRQKIENLTTAHQALDRIYQGSTNEERREVESTMTAATALMKEYVSQLSADLQDKKNLKEVFPYASLVIHGPSEGEK